MTSFVMGILTRQKCQNQEYRSQIHHNPGMVQIWIGDSVWILGWTGCDDMSDEICPELSGRIARQKLEAVLRQLRCEVHPPFVSCFLIGPN